MIARILRNGGLCPGDSGGPLARKTAGAAIVVGVNHGYTFWMKDGRIDVEVPVTNVHTRLDATSRWGVGGWPMPERP